jgi:hypothetical protein
MVNISIWSTSKSFVLWNSLYFSSSPHGKISYSRALSWNPALHHAALAIGALASSRYYPDIRQTPPAIAFSIRHYSMAIQDLHRRFDGSSRSLELAVLTSLFFSFIEFLLGLDSRIEMHIQAGCAILESLHANHNRTLAVSTQAGSNGQVGSLSSTYDLLARAMFQLTAQVNCIWAFRSDSNH